MQVAVYHIESAGQTELYCLETFSGFAVEIFYYGKTHERLCMQNQDREGKIFYSKEIRILNRLLMSFIRGTNADQQADLPSIY